MAALLDIVKKGSTDRSVTIRIIDSTDGTPETGVEHDTSGIDLWYRREGAAKTSITEAALAALTTAHTDGGIEHIGDGEYRLDLPDAAFASGVNHVDVGGTVTGMIVIGGRVRLVDYDPEDAVRLGLTALPNAAADAAGGLIVSDAGGLDADAQRSDVAAILVDTAEIGAAGAGLTEAGGTGDHLTALPWNAAWDAEVESEATDALNAYDPPTKAELDSGLAGLNDLSAAEVNAEVDTALADYDGPTKAEMDAGFAALNDPTAAAVAVAVWDALQSSHVTAGSFGEIATEIASILADTNELQTDDVPGLIAALENLSASAAADAVWDEAQSGHTGAGTFGELATEIATILVDTGTDIPALIAALNNLSAAQVNAEVDTALADYDPPTRAEATSDKDEVLTRLGSPAGASVSADIAAIPNNVRDTVLPKQGEALSNIPVYLVDATDHKTPETGLSPSVTVSKDGGAPGAITGSITEVGNGVYEIDASAADMNGGVCVFRVTDPAAADFVTVIFTSGGV